MPAQISLSDTGLRENNRVLSTITIKPLLWSKRETLEKKLRAVVVWTIVSHFTSTIQRKIHRLRDIFPCSVFEWFNEVSGKCLSSCLLSCNSSTQIACFCLAVTFTHYCVYVLSQPLAQWIVGFLQRSSDSMTLWIWDAGATLNLSCGLSFQEQSQIRYRSLESIPQFKKIKKFGPFGIWNRTHFEFFKEIWVPVSKVLS